MNSLLSAMEKTVDDLCEEISYKSVFHSSNHESSMPSISELKKVIQLFQSVIYPGYFGNSDINLDTMRYYIGMQLDQIVKLLIEQIERVICFECKTVSNANSKIVCTKNTESLIEAFIKEIPKIRAHLISDVSALHSANSSTKSAAHSIFTSPSIYAITVYRMAHELFKLSIPLIPNILAEIAHRNTGISISPQAKIRENVYIGHGSGIFIGETCEIGKNVRIYQGVSIGESISAYEEGGNLQKDIPRHPVIEDNVMIYFGAKLSGRITIGEGSVIGGNVWVDYDVPPNSTIIA